ncbi:MAG: 23S rRNA (guanosine(2251)-2'-O)-methyltransferase RlmB [Bacilli bacterium]|nr:23S rRNA (guanosine(2251)-2'-O)-methyltransferase RlmB [Bacilli bacterium]
MKVFGKNVFNELRENVSSIKKVYLSKNFTDKDIINFIKDNGISYSVMDQRKMDGMVEGRHQGIIIVVDDYEYSDYKEMLNDNIVVMLDHLEDPHNFGAIIRTCEAAGIKSIIIPKDRSVSVTSTVMKTSAGALEHVNIAMVNNLVNVMDDFKDNGFFVYAADMDGENYKGVDFADKVLLVIGSEGNGVGRLVKKNCDQILSIPMYGRVNSLNASVAAAILIYGIVNK